MVSILKKLNRFARKWLFILAHVGEVTRFVNNPKLAYSYHPELPGKSKVRVWFELIGWLFRHGEVNIYYYAYGFDVGSVDQRAYMALNEFKALRNIRNGAIQIGKHATSYTGLLKDKFAFYLFLSSLGFPTPKVFGICIGERIDWLDTHTTEGIDSLTKRAGLKAFCKTILGECAEGAFPLRVWESKLLLDGAPVTLSDLKQRLRGGFIIQEFIEQHPRTAELYPPCLNTLRIDTIRKRNGITLFCAGMKIGANASTRDNWASGGLFGLIDHETGRLAKEFVFRPGCGGLVTKHPQSGVVFEGYEIPYFKEAMRMVMELHSFLYGIHSVGWDVAITKDGPIIIEGNDNWGIPAHQAIMGGLRASLRDALAPAGKEGSC
jgi:hypothetical protein